MYEGIQIRQASFHYNNSRQLLKNISLSIPKGNICGITGVNGSGKTTLTLLLNGLIPHIIPGKLTGDVFIDGINTRSKPFSFFAQKVGMVFQNPDFMLFNLTVVDEIAFGLKNFNLDNHEKRITDALSMVGLNNFEKRDPHTLSLGEKQKLALACILATDTPYIVLDEPIAMLDYKGAINLYRTLTSINKKAGKTIIVVEHDTDFIFTHAHQTVIIDKGEILFQGDTESVFTKREKLRQLGIKIPRKLR